MLAQVKEAIIRLKNPNKPIRQTQTLEVLNKQYCAFKKNNTQLHQEAWKTPDDG